MKKNICSLLILFCSLTASLYFAACKKDSSKINITLHDKSLSVIQSYIRGKWDLKYEQGGIAYGTYPQTNSTWTFTSDNRIIESYHDTIVSDASITWVRDHGLFLGPNDLTHIMTPGNYVIDGIFNDTRKLCDRWHF